MTPPPITPSTRHHRRSPASRRPAGSRANQTTGSPDALASPTGTGQRLSFMDAVRLPARYRLTLSERVGLHGRHRRHKPPGTASYQA